MIAKSIANVSIKVYQGISNVAVYPGVYPVPPALTAPMVERLKADPTKRIEVSDGLLPAFRLVIQPNGSKSYAIRYRQDGQQKKYTIGSKKAYSLAEAREAARDALARAARGENLTASKAQARNARVVANISKDDFVENVVDDYILRHVAKLKSAKEVQRLLRVELKPWKGKKIHTISRRDVRDLIEAVHERGAPNTSRLLLANIKAFFSWLLDRDIVQSSPCVNVKPLSRVVERERFLSDAELATVLLAADRQGFPFGPMVRILVLTTTRRSEAAKMRWNELNLTSPTPTWTLTSARTKNSKPHNVPLSVAAVKVLSSLPRIQNDEGDAVFVFTTNGKVPVSGFSKFKAALDLNIRNLREEAFTNFGHNEAEPVPMPEWKLHDLRRTFATGCQRLGVELATIEKCLNHTSGSFAGIVGTYNKHDYAAEMRAAFTRWGEHVDSLLAASRQTDNQDD